ncbi:ankyrin [Fusarium tjaetaba]|uniref:Ankyrin n=1 Tax=Fusarium tjaetaba TaxID=1567544 RepID=A0A8H5VDD1_9HYPO|nr:ankyrin [Fusarium tjaetaba]KAF5618198.1 ankyrin [Fusarium tjaetaba]
MSDASNQPARAGSLTPEMIEFASRMYDAARKGDVATFEQALPAGLPPNLTNDKGDTLLMLAAYHGHADLVKVLIQHGADPNRLNDRGQSPLAGAVFKKEDAVIQKIKELLDGGADPEYGQPSAAECITMFKQEDTWKSKFDAAPGKGQAGKTREAGGKK